MRTILLTTALALVATASAAQQNVVVVTSFPKDLTDPFKAAFEAAHPDYQLEVVSRNTNASVAFLQETKGSNTTDLFWASAPDAFEVLKSEGLLAKVDIAAEGIPDTIGSYPINDPDGSYYGFAASGYGIMYNTRYIEANDLPVATEILGDALTPGPGEAAAVPARPRMMRSAKQSGSMPQRGPRPRNTPQSWTS